MNINQNRINVLPSVYSFSRLSSGSVMLLTGGINRRPSTCANNTFCRRFQLSASLCRGDFQDNSTDGRFFVLVKIRINFPLLPDMVAGGQTVSSGIKQVVSNSRGQPETVCGVFSVGDDNVNMVFCFISARCLTITFLPARPTMSPQYSIFKSASLQNWLHRYAAAAGFAKKGGPPRP